MINLLAYTILLGLAAFRGTYFLRYDSITESLRDWVWYQYPPSNELLKTVNPNYESVPVDMNGTQYNVVHKGHWFGELTRCHWCLSGWITLGLLASSWTVIPVFTFGTFLLTWLAAWAIAVFALTKSLS